MLHQHYVKGPAKRLEADLDLIDGGFADYLRQRHASAFTIAHYCRFLRRVAKYLAKRGHSAATLPRRDVPRIMRGCLPGWKAASRRTRQSGLLQWLRFTGRFHEPIRRARWQRWLDAYEHFLRFDRALADCTEQPPAMPSTNICPGSFAVGRCAGIWCPRRTCVGTLLCGAAFSVPRA